MIVELQETSSSKIMTALLNARRSVGSPALSMVLTLVIVVGGSSRPDDPEQSDGHADAMNAALRAAKEHPSRIIGVVLHDENATPRLDAEISIGEGVPGESVLLRMHGELTAHAESVVTPLLLPESPVVVWWPGKAPESMSTSPIGRLATRRIADAAAEPDPRAAVARRCGSYSPGDTDLTWTRTTTWRALLAAALDQSTSKVTGVVVQAEQGTASAELIAAWLSKRLRVQARVTASDGPGITAVRLATKQGEIAITRPTGVLARYEIPGQPERTVALKRRDVSELLAEELRHLDPDEVFAETAKELLDRSSGHEHEKESL